MLLTKEQVKEMSFDQLEKAVQEVEDIGDSESAKAIIDAVNEVLETGYFANDYDLCERLRDARRRAHEVIKFENKPEEMTKVTLPKMIQVNKICKMENKAYQFTEPAYILSRHDEWTIVCKKQSDTWYEGEIYNKQTGAKYAVFFYPVVELFGIPEYLPAHIQARTRVCFKRLFRKCN